MSNKYPIETFEQMLEIPADRLEAFCSELPALLQAVQSLRAGVKAAGGTGTRFSRPPLWIDDGKQDVKLSLQINQTGATQAEGQGRRAPREGVGE